MVDGFLVHGKCFPVLVGDVFQRVPYHMYNAALLLRLRECRRYGFLNTREPVRTENEDILHTAVLQLVQEADRGAWKQMQPFLERSTVIGEIGMDSVWCRTPLALQQEIFELQLAFACEKRRPVILHTKGGKTVADIIRQYPNTYLVHWYSLGSGLKNYMEMDCYFSVGPGVWWNPAVRKLAGEIAADHLLIETDSIYIGRSSGKYAWGGG